MAKLAMKLARAFTIETLRQLEKLVDEYSSLGKPKDPDIPVTRKWKRDLKDGWKKLAWTAEGGELATLRSQLAVHTNSLNLILTVATQSDIPQQQAGSIDTEEISMAESDVHVVQSERTEQLRLIVASRDGSTVLSHELAKDFLSEQGGKPNYRSPTYVALVEGNGTLKVRNEPSSWTWSSSYLQ
ncbi:hypothetical protein VTG60DRAFT_6732 [Thermothelomyces hinnuleus]